MLVANIDEYSERSRIADVKNSHAAAFYKGVIQMIDDDEYYPCDNCDNLCDEWERQYCCELCRYYGGGDEMECAHCDPMNI